MIGMLPIACRTCQDNSAVLLAQVDISANDKLIQGNIINGYAIPYFDVLHTQGKKYVTDDLVRLMRHEGVIP